MTAKALSLREGIIPPVRDRLLATILLAGMLHALIILGVTFSSNMETQRLAPGLEVVLVSEELPSSERNDSATYLAQRTQLGSGNTRESVAIKDQRPAKPPQPAMLSAAEVNEAEHVLFTAGWSTEVSYLTMPGDLLQSESFYEQITATPDLSDPDTASDETTELRGMPREELWLAADSRASRLAPYLDAWRRKVERIGTLNYPASALGKSADINPVLEVAIQADGKLMQAKIRTSSGVPELDQAALDILKLSSPFDAFPPELSQEYRLLRFAYEWRFSAAKPPQSPLQSLP
jgi:periplasmic protein TonB